MRKRANRPKTKAQTGRRLFVYIRPHIIGLVVALLTTGILNALRSTQPLFTRYAIDWYIEPARTDGLKWLVLGFIMVRLITFGLFYYQTLLLSSFAQLITLDLRFELFQKLQKLDLAYFDRTPIGHILTRLTSDLDSLGEFLTSGIKDGLGDLILTISVVSIMLWTDWQLTLVALTIVPLIFLTLRWFSQRVRRGYTELRSRLAELSAFLQEHLAGSLTIQLLNHEARSLQKFRQVNNDFCRTIKRNDFYYSTFIFLLDTVGALGVTFVVWYGGYRVMHHTDALSIGTFVAFVLYSQQLLQPIRGIADKYAVFNSALVAAQRLFEMLDQPTKVTSPEQAKKTGRAKGHIEFQNVWFAYNDEDWVLKDVSFVVEPSEIIAIVGQTGSGKTTLVNLLLRFYDVQRGRVLLDGVDVRDWDLRDLRSTFGVVLQDPFLARRTVADNIKLDRDELDEQRIAWAAQEACTTDFIEKLPDSFATELQGRCSNLSTGQKQLISLARAIAMPQAVLILDEATSSVDPLTEELIQQTTCRLIRSHTTLMIAHRLSVIEAADRIVVMDRGVVAEQGSHEELLLKGGLYWRLDRLRYRSTVNMVQQSEFNISTGELAQASVAGSS